jgi:hypothetical protein
MTLNPDYLFRLAKLTQQERIKEAEKHRLVRRRVDGWWAPPVRWQAPGPEGRAQRRAS